MFSLMMGVGEKDECLWEINPVFGEIFVINGAIHLEKGEIPSRSERFLVRRGNPPTYHDATTAS